MVSSHRIFNYGNGLFLIPKKYSPDDGIMEKACRWRCKNLQDRICAFFVKPQPTATTTPPSLTDLATRRVADEILSEDSPFQGSVHPLLADIPQHLRDVVNTLVDNVRAEKATVKQRKYCVDALRSVEKFLAFDHRHFNPTATSRGTPEWDDRKVDDDLMTTDGDESPDRRLLWFKSPERFVEWKECAVEIDQAEQYWGKWAIDNVNPPANPERFVDGFEFPPHRLNTFP